MLPAALSSSVTIFARASAAAMNSSSRSLVLRETRQPSPIPAAMCSAGLSARQQRGKAVAGCWKLASRQPRPVPLQSEA